MKVTLERGALLKSLAHVQSVVEKRHTIPILGTVLIRAKGNEVSFTATDMEIEINESISASVTKAGAVTAPAHMLYEIVRKLPDGSQVELKATDAEQMTLTAGRSTFRLGCLPVDDFPKIPEGDLKNGFELAAGSLRVLIDRTRFAISAEETRYYLNGIYMHAKAVDGLNVLRTVATDGHRMSRVEMPAPEGAMEMPGIIIPRKTVNEIRKLLDETNDMVTLSMSESKIRFTIDGTVITSKLIDGTFPDYERVIPVGNDKILTVNTKDFAKATDRVATVATEKARAVRMKMSSGQLLLSANSPDAGSASEELEATYEGEELDVGFNARYLLEMLQQIEGEGVVFSFADSTAPAVIRDASDAGAVFVLMPMRV